MVCESPALQLTFARRVNFTSLGRFGVLLSPAESPVERGHFLRGIKQKALRFPLSFGTHLFSLLICIEDRISISGLMNFPNAGLALGCFASPSRQLFGNYSIFTLIIFKYFNTNIFYTKVFCCILFIWSIFILICKM